ncbi:MAG TPA: 16S rRNA (adenine(1518)-N(6)/adenine(1519)-N(6))-dimethyltransferase RsmA [Pyrinomonadaceae bacterium]|nr:16S rRNA (adenine(1518)-N(6)/adenine(1519)-N(6))-dimethyltransferase RsmA [Pyrinomonadaceae bacterium]
MARYTSEKTTLYAPAKRSLGQNFLSDQNIIETIVGILGEITDRSIVEIGPGRGALTRPLLERGANLTVIELDDALAALLEKEFATEAKFACRKANVLDVDIAEISSSETIIIGNLPYYISTAIIRHLINYREHFKLLVLMLQREVADRIAAKPGESDRGFLTVLVEQYLTVSREFDVPPGAFTPRPKVWSSIVSLEPRNDTISDGVSFEKLVSAAFAQKRKTILNNLKNYNSDSAEILSKAAIDSKRRAETLSRDEWIDLFEAFRKAKEA